MRGRFRWRCWHRPRSPVVVKQVLPRKTRWNGSASGCRRQSSQRTAPKAGRGRCGSGSNQISDNRDHSDVGGLDVSAGGRCPVSRLRCLARGEARWHGRELRGKPFGGLPCIRLSQFLAKVGYRASLRPVGGGGVVSRRPCFRGKQTAARGNGGHLYTASHVRTRNGAGVMESECQLNGLNLEG